MAYSLSPSSWYLILYIASRRRHIIVLCCTKTYFNKSSICFDRHIHTHTYTQTWHHKSISTLQNMVNRPKNQMTNYFSPFMSYPRGHRLLALPRVCLHASRLFWPLRLSDETADLTLRTTVQKSRFSADICEMPPGQRISVVINGLMSRNICKYGRRVVSAKIVVISSDMVKVPGDKVPPLSHLWRKINSTYGLCFPVHLRFI
jgi:hypothetical protein